MNKIKLSDITFYENKQFITVPYEGGRSVLKERKRVDLRNLNKRVLHNGLSHYSGIVEGVIDRKVSFWRLKKTKKLKNGERMRFFSHFDNEEDAIKAYAKFTIQAINT